MKEGKEGNRKKMRKEGRKGKGKEEGGGEVEEREKENENIGPLHAFVYSNPFVFIMLLLIYNL